MSALAISAAGIAVSGSVVALIVKQQQRARRRAMRREQWRAKQAEIAEAWKQAVER
jgi:antitoxin (DNA-binding transcriptional repressor) of toxin-antitoxin stability system